MQKSASKQKNHEENTLLLLQYIQEQTQKDGGLKLNINEEAKSFKVPYYTDIYFVLKKAGIVLNTGAKGSPCYVYQSKVEPNMVMAREILKKVADYKKGRKAIETKEVLKEAIVVKGTEPAKAWQAGLDNGTIDPVEKFKPNKTERGGTPQVPASNSICVSDDVFAILKKIQVLTLLDDKVSSRTINTLINEQLEKKPSLKNSYRKFITKSE